MDCALSPGNFSTRWRYREDIPGARTQPPGQNDGQVCVGLPRARRKPASPEWAVCGVGGQKGMGVRGKHRAGNKGG